MIEKAIFLVSDNTYHVTSSNQDGWSDETLRHIGDALLSKVERPSWWEAIILLESSGYRTLYSYDHPRNPDLF